MKTIVMSDQHLGKFWRSNNSAFSRARKLIQSFRYNLELAYNDFKEEDCLQLIFAGDFFDSSHANTEMLVYIKDELYDILRNFRYRNIIAGNHEIFIDKESIQQSLIDVAFPVTSLVYVNDVENIYYKQYNLNYILIPYMTNLSDVIYDALDKTLRNDCNNIIIGHFTPKEIFSYEKFILNEVIDHYSDHYSIPYILLGHYHKPCAYKYNKTYILSIGNSYYHTIDDVRDIVDNPDDKTKQKRYIVIDDATMKVYSRPYLLPMISEYNVIDQDEFNNNIIETIRTSYPDNVQKQNTIIYIKSKNLIDYSQLTFDGYEVYFDLIETADASIMTFNEVIADANLDAHGASQSLNDRWNKYIDVIPENLLNSNEKQMASWLFDRRNDLDITVDKIIAQLNKSDWSSNNGQ